MKNNSSVTPLTDNGIKMARYSREKGFLDREKTNILETNLEAKTENFIKVVSQIRGEQNRLNRDSLKWLYERIRGIYYVLSEAERELKQGDLILAELVEVFRKDVPSEQFWAIVRKENGSILGEYPDNNLETLLETIEGHKEYLEQPQIVKIIEND